MKDLNACEELLEKYIDALVVCAALHYFGMESVNDVPKLNTIKSLNMELDPQGYAITVIGEIVNKFIHKQTPHFEKSTISEKHKCNTCNRKYKKITSLLKHIKEKHKTE